MLLKPRVVKGFTVTPMQGVTIISFGYKHGDQPGDVVLDLRRLIAPPHWSIDPISKEYQKGLTDNFGEIINSIIEVLKGLNVYLDQITIAIGCSEGQQRSVSFAYALSNKLDIPHQLLHRDWRNAQKFI